MLIAPICRYGNAMAMALENSPVDARGFMSGILQQGYAFGYVCAACANLGVGGDTDSWKTVFWIAAGLSIGVGIIRCFFPESKQFLEARKEGKAHANPSQFWRETKVMLRQEWKMCVYCCILMTWFNCKSRPPRFFAASYRQSHSDSPYHKQTTATPPRTITPPSHLKRRNWITRAPAVPVSS